MSVIEREHTHIHVDPAREGRARVLEAAALEIEVRGWCQGMTEDDAGRVCAIGGIIKSAPLLNPRAVWEGHDNGLTVIGVAGFNDAPDRTAGEVTFVLRWRAAEIRDGR